MMRFDFTNKRVLLTGGTRGIANAAVEAFNKAGAQIAINGRTADSVAQAIGRFPDNQRLFAAPGDVGRVAVCENALNSTGVGLDVSMAESDESLWDTTLGVNLKASLDKFDSDNFRFAANTGRA